jgi:hypothetical protein
MTMAAAAAMDGVLEALLKKVLEVLLVPPGHSNWRGGLVVDKGDRIASMAGGGSPRSRAFLPESLQASSSFRAFLWPHHA